jgi:CO dehydrogenase maturation factor
VAPELLAAIEAEGLNLAGVIPEDDEIYQWDQTGKPTSDISPDNPAVAAAWRIFKKTLPAA